VTEFIDQVTPVTVITNALPVMEKLRGMQDIELIALGGKYHPAHTMAFSASHAKSDPVPPRGRCTLCRPRPSRACPLHPR
jgi:hypothetical protein